MLKMPGPMVPNVKDASPMVPNGEPGACIVQVATERTRARVCVCGVWEGGGGGSNHVPGLACQSLESQHESSSKSRLQQPGGVVL